MSVKTLYLENSFFKNVTTLGAGAIIKMNGKAYNISYFRNLTILSCFASAGAVLDFGLTYEMFVFDNLYAECFSSDSSALVDP